MAAQPFHCPDCGRRYAPEDAPEGARLFCRECGGELAPGSGEGPKKAKDPFKGRLIAGARLRKLVGLTPSRRVYRARHNQLKTDVRVEVFPSAFAGGHSDYMERLFRHAALTRELRSVHVVTLLEIGRRRDCWFLMTDWVPSDLRRLLDRGGRVGLNQALLLAEQILRGLCAVEEAGGAHGNVSPEGILITLDGSARLDHLGTILPPGENLCLTVTDGGTVTGRVAYAAPELTDGGYGPSIPGDLYSFGITLFEMIAGEPPFRGRSGEDLARLHREEPLPDLLEAAPDAPAELAAFVQRLAAKEPERRPETAAQALAELQELGVELSRRGKIGRVRAAVTKRERVYQAVRWTTGWTVLALVLIVLSIVPGVLMCRERAERKAVEQRARAEEARTVLILVGGGPDAGEDRLPERRTEAVRAVLRHALAFHPEFDVLSEDDVGERSVNELMRDYGVDYVLLADHQPGIGRRKWTLSFVAQGEERWGVKSECAVEEGAPNGLAPLEEAAGELLSQAATTLNLPTAEVEVPVTGMAPGVWVAMRRAVAAERDGDLGMAVTLCKEAEGRSAGMARLLSAYCETVLEVRSSGEFAAPDLPDTASLPPDLAGLGPCLAVLATGNRTALEEEMGAYLAGNPESVRGYLLLGLWRLHGEGDPEAALAALRHAARLDADYMPAARECVDLLRQLHPEQVDDFLRRHAERASNKERAFRLRTEKDEGGRRK